MRLKLLMADVDGTLNTGRDEVSPEVACTIRRLQEDGIIVGLVSGRTDPMLVRMAESLGINGPLISENGAVARMHCRDGLLDLGYSRRPAVEALQKLKNKYPDCIREREDNCERMIDLVFFADGIDHEELKSCVKDVQLLDSTYILHLMQKGIDKGRTLKKVLGHLYDGKVKPGEVLVVGDSMTDLPLFRLFPQSVLIPNPDIPSADRKKLEKAARYTSNHQAGEGFAEVASHIISARTQKV